MKLRDDMNAEDKSPPESIQLRRFYSLQTNYIIVDNEGHKK